MTLRQKCTWKNVCRKIIRSTWVFSGVRVARSLVSVYCFVDHCLSFCSIFIWPLHCLSFDYPFGRYPLWIDIKVRMISYWCKLIQRKQSKLFTIAYKLLYVKNFQNCKISAWINHIHKILNDSGMSYIWTLHNCISEKWLKLVIKNNLTDQFKQIWNSSIETSSKGSNHKLFKEELKFENYLDI
jgi:hypothetical protein